MRSTGLLISGVKNQATPPPPPPTAAAAQGAEVRLTTGSWKRVQCFTLHAIRRTPHGASRRFALGASNVCLVGDNPSAPFRHSRDVRVYGHTTLRPCTNWVHPAPPTPYTVDLV